MAQSPAAQPEAAPKPAVSQGGGGPSIIHVNPEDASKGSGVIVIRDPSTVPARTCAPRTCPTGRSSRTTPSAPCRCGPPMAGGPSTSMRDRGPARAARVAIVIGGLAVSQTGTQAAIEKLPAEVTLAFASQGNSIGRWMQAARRKGHRDPHAGTARAFRLSERQSWA